MGEVDEVVEDEGGRGGAEKERKGDREKERENRTERGGRPREKRREKVGGGKETGIKSGE